LANISKSITYRENEYILVFPPERSAKEEKLAQEKEVLEQKEEVLVQEEILEQEEERTARVKEALAQNLYVLFFVLGLLGRRHALLLFLF
jgi:hypothetical protein